MTMNHNERSPLPLRPLLESVVAQAETVMWANMSYRALPLYERDVVAHVEPFLMHSTAMKLSIVNHAICNLRRVTVFAYRIVSLHNGDTAKTLEGTLDLTNYHIWFARPFPDPPPTDAYLSSLMRIMGSDYDSDLDINAKGRLRLRILDGESEMGDGDSVSDSDVLGTDSDSSTSDILIWERDRWRRASGSPNRRWQ